MCAVLSCRLPFTPRCQGVFLHISMKWSGEQEKGRPATGAHSQTNWPHHLHPAFTRWNRPMETLLVIRVSPSLSPCYVPWAKYIKINSHHKSECHGIASEKLFCFTRLPGAKSKRWHLRRLTPHPRLQFVESELMCGPVCVLLKAPLCPCMLICFGWNQALSQPITSQQSY